MRPVTFAFAGKLLVVPAGLLTLAGCGDSATPVDDEAPAAETAIVTPAPTEPEVAATPAKDVPVAVPTQAPSPSAAPSASARKASPAPVATPAPTPTAKGAADPHAGHDMSNMSEEDMKAMGHD